jgi:arabinan endo-1,5-alpha-L-arabinosidase
MGILGEPMRMSGRATLAAILACTLAGCAGAATIPGQMAPGIDADFPDPAVLRAGDGYYYAYATQGTAAGAMRNIQVARSRDLSAWEQLGDALPLKPQWANETQDFWAPHVSARDGRYVLYYSAKPDEALTDPARGLCLGVATAARPEGPFVDVGRPLRCGAGFANIDPMAYDDPASGRRLLYWGSGFQPIRVQDLAPDGLSFAPGSAPVDLVDVIKTDDPGTYRRLVEGAWVVRRRGWYYLFFSGDNCCGEKAHYAVMVARSRSATGPFAVKPEQGGVILEADRRWIAPGHNSVIVDRRGRWRILYHAVDTRRPATGPADPPNSRRVMLVGTLRWGDDWPFVESRQAK